MHKQRSRKLNKRRLIFLIIIIIGFTWILYFSITSILSLFNQTESVNLPEPTAKAIVTTTPVPTPTMVPVDPATIFDQSVFIGNSRMQALYGYNDIPNSSLLAHVGISIDKLATEKDFYSNGEQVTSIEKLKTIDFESLYIMMGSNELGWIYPNVFIEKYVYYLNEVRKINPDVKIYVLNILPVGSDKDRSSSIYNMKNIKKFNEYIDQMGFDYQIEVIDTSKCLVDEDGYLMKEASSDGVHLNEEYAKIWLDNLREIIYEKINS